MSNLRVIGVGRPTLDYLISVPSRPHFGASMTVKRLGTEGGGPVPTALVTLRRLGFDAALAARLGLDEIGEKITEGLRREGIDLRHVQYSAESRSASSTILVTPGADRAILHDPGRATIPGITAELLADIGSSDGLLVDRVTDASLETSAHAHEHGTLVLLDAGGFDERVMELVPFSNIVIGAEYHAEARGLDPVDAIDELLGLGVEVAIITLGDKGSVGRVQGGELVRIPAMKVAAVDTTGAGDVYHGAFMASWLRERDLEQGMRFASVVAALKCRKPGGRAGIPTLDEAMDALARWDGESSAAG